MSHLRGAGGRRSADRLDHRANGSCPLPCRFVARSRASRARRRSANVGRERCTTSSHHLHYPHLDHAKVTKGDDARCDGNEEDGERCRLRSRLTFRVGSTKQYPIVARSTLAAFRPGDSGTGQWGLWEEANARPLFQNQGAAAVVPGTLGGLTIPSDQLALPNSLSSQSPRGLRPLIMPTRRMSLLAKRSEFARERSWRWVRCTT